MTKGLDKIIAFPGDTDRADSGAVAAIRVVPKPSGGISAAGNIIPFIRMREAGNAPAVVLRPDQPANDDAAPTVTLKGEARPRMVVRLSDRRAWLAGLLVVSLLVHAALFAAFWKEPEPLASIGLQAISVEVVLGADQPAGLAPQQGQNEVEAARRESDTVREQPAEETTTAQPQEVPVDRKETEVRAAEVQEPKVPEPAAQEPRAEVPKPEDPKPSVAMVETPQAEVPTAPPPPAPPETQVTLVPSAEPVEMPKEPAATLAKPKPAEPEKQPKKPAQPVERAEKRQRVAARTTEERPNPRPVPRSTPATPAGGVGPGRSQLDTNYRGLVSAHLARHKQFPAEARSRGLGGTGTVSFAFDGNGRVTAVRLVRGSGVPSLDQELQAMVRRASPFPAPPDRRSQSFTQTVSFRLN